jgi:hypothetical protein
MALDLARLRAIARGDVEPKNGRNHVTDPGYANSVTPVTPQGYAKNPRSYASYAGYAKNAQGWKRDELGGQFEGVTDGVTHSLPSPETDPDPRQEAADHRNRAAAEAGLTDRWCACGTMAMVAVGHFRADRGNPEGVARWVCSECFEAPS